MQNLREFNLTASFETWYICLKNFAFPIYCQIIRIFEFWTGRKSEIFKMLEREKSKGLGGFAYLLIINNYKSRI
jgi:hypothetical protein